MVAIAGLWSRCFVGRRGRQGRRNDLCENFAEVDARKGLQQLGQRVGISGRSLEKMMAIVDAAEKHPRKFSRLKEEMDRTSKVAQPLSELLHTKDEQRILRLRPTNGKFQNLVIRSTFAAINHPRYERLRTPYATMSHEELLALPVAEWGDENSHLYCWATNANMEDAIEL